jgi:hypothetical protein
MRGWIAALLTLAVCISAGAQSGTGAQEVTHAAQAWLASLDKSQHAEAQLPLDSPERSIWTYLPQARKGLPLKRQTDTQQAAAIALVKASLSAAGFETVSTIRRLEVVLRDELKSMPQARDPDMYYLLVFGEPGDKGAWGLRFEGHHISLNFTMRDGRIVSSTPQFFGSNPHQVLEGSMKGTRVLGAIEDLAKTLLASLDDTQRKKAIAPGDAPEDILTRFDPVATPPDATQGIAYAELKPEQQAALMKVLGEAAGVQRPGVAAARMTKLREAGLEKIRFVWMGGAGPGDKNYYRVQGPTFVFEYDNTQNDGNHSHSAWRDFAGDFGRDVLKEHYKAAHNPAGASAAGH